MASHRDTDASTSPWNEGPADIDSEASTIGPLPEHIGRYRVERLLGQGGFGTVYLARDDQLQRPVAIKVPHARLLSRPEDAELYLAEARTVASLEHPHIVPVYDVGQTEAHPCFVVSKYVEGGNLAVRLARGRISDSEGAELVASIAEALHHAHKRGLVHRDVKPANILLDRQGQSFLADFGLALREWEPASESCQAGTPAYMSPEQIHGHGRSIDGRSDVFSLGVVLYELLTAQIPFRGRNVRELWGQITAREPKPLRQWDESIPPALEAVCLKMLAKHPADRYSTAHDLARDLRLAVQSTADRQRGPTGPSHTFLASGADANVNRNVLLIHGAAPGMPNSRRRRLRLRFGQPTPRR